MEEKTNIVAEYTQQILKQARQVVVGKDDVLQWALAAILAKGHILLEDVPGVGKTTMALTFSKILSLDYNRVQFTPDVLPSDITGYSIPDQRTGEIAYQKGAIICNLFLADELNRATSRTQSALLEAMEEGQVTVDGISHMLPTPFVVIATQNPTGAAGTQLLPDSQMDRFIVRLSLGYPAPKEEVSMVMDRQAGNPLHKLTALLTKETLTAMQAEVESTYVKDAVVKYVVDLIVATRKNENIFRGASPRATLAVTAMAKAMARIYGRDYVLPEDVQEVFVRTVSHRLLLPSKAEGRRMTPEQVLTEILNKVSAPKMY